VSTGCKYSHSGFPDVSCSNDKDKDIRLDWPTVMLYTEDAIHIGRVNMSLACITTYFGTSVALNVLRKNHINYFKIHINNHQVTSKYGLHFSSQTCS